MALGVGVTAGLPIGRRWSVVVAPVVFLADLEQARLGTDGPAVDEIHLGSTYGLTAWIAILRPPVATLETASDGRVITGAARTASREADDRIGRRSDTRR